MSQGRAQLNRTRYEQRRRFVENILSNNTIIINNNDNKNGCNNLYCFREEEASLREEQDREFRETLEQDRRAQELKQRVNYFLLLSFSFFFY